MFRAGFVGFFKVWNFTTRMPVSAGLGARWRAVSSLQVAEASRNEKGR
jgi:hypothetical protein